MLALLPVRRLFPTLLALLVLAVVWLVGEAFKGPEVGDLLYWLVFAVVVWRILRPKADQSAYRLLLRAVLRACKPLAHRLRPAVLALRLRVAHQSIKPLVGGLDKGQLRQVQPLLPTRAKAAYQRLKGRRLRKAIPRVLWRPVLVALVHALRPVVHKKIQVEKVPK